DEKTNIARAYADDELPGARERRAISEAYRRAAQHRGIEPAAMQAVVWLYIRELPRWIKPTHRSHAERARLWRRQAKARIALGLTVPYDWNNAAPLKAQAYV